MAGTSSARSIFSEFILRAEEVLAIPIWLLLLLSIFVHVLTTLFFHITYICIFFVTLFEFTENLSQPVGAGAPVKILGGRGNISITASPDNQAHAFVHKYVRTESQNEANQLNDSTHAKFEQQGDTLVLEMVSGNFERGRFDLDRK